MERNVEIITDSEKKKIVIRDISEMPGMDGIDMMHILDFLYMMKKEKSRGIIVSGQQC